jgi:hypothetical protein
MDTEIEELPTDFDLGLDFLVSKTQKGGYADYSTSKWSRKESELDSQERAAIEAHGLFDLSEFLPKKPGETELKIIHQMFEASVDGQPYDPDLFGQYYKPAGLQVSGSNNNTPRSAPAPAPAAQTPAPVTEATTDTGWTEPAPAAPSAESGDTKTADILAMIRQRKTVE